MRPLYLELSGWGSYPKKNIVDFKSFHTGELFLITGPTGSGKTTIFDGITYALYGETSGDIRSQNKDQIRSDFAKTEIETYVILKFSHQGHEYEVKRQPRYKRPKKRGEGFTLKKEEAELFKDGGLVTSGIAQVNDAIHDILSIDYRQFKQLSMLAQGEFMNLLSVGSKDRVEILRSIFHTQIYENIQALAGQKARRIREEIKELNYKMQESVAWLQDQEDIDPLIEICDFKSIIAKLKDKEKSSNQKIKKTNGELEKIQEDLEKLQEKNTYIQGKVFDYEKSKKELAVLQKEEAQWKEKLNQCIINENAIKEQTKYIETLLPRKAILEEAFHKTEEGKVILQNLNKAKQQLEESKIRLGLAVYQEWEKENQAIKQQKNQVEKKKVKLEETKVEYQRIDQELLEEKNNLAKIQSCYYAGNVGVLAAGLVDGEPCPVCGSTYHPDIAAPAKEIITKTDVEEQNLKVANLDELYQKLYQRLSNLKESLQVEERTLKEREKNQIKEPQWDNQWKKFHGKVRTTVEEEQSTKQAHELWATTKGQWDGLSKDVKDLLLKKDDLEEEYNIIHEEISSYETNKSKILAEKENTSLSYAKIQTRVESEEKICKQLESSLPLNEEINSISKELETKRREKEKIEIQRESLVICHEKMKQSIKSLNVKDASKETLEKTYGIVGDVDRLLNGNNGLRLTLEQYVLISYFQDILHAANIRLRKMTNGRYEMFRQESVKDGRKKDHLEIEVLDYYTGKRRSVKTLSGGESFKAALCLALGLSDVIQQYVGGIEIEILFVDEGFGALDEESLEQAIDTLISLAGEHRMIGIISHVSELKNRVDKQVIVHKEKEGSSVVIKEGTN